MQNLSPQLCPKIQQIIDDLRENGYAICDAFLSADSITGLADKASMLYLAGEMREARTSLDPQTQLKKFRGDCTFWLNEDSLNLNVQAYFANMLVLRAALNQYLFMNVQEIESHLAVFPIGSVYTKHLDQFQQGDSTFGVQHQTRQLSSILYLNQDWLADDGGALRLYLAPQSITALTPAFIDIAPTAGKLVLFLSHDFWHEVLPAKAERISLAGWFRTRN